MGVLFDRASAGGGGGGDAWSDPVDANIVPDGDNTRSLGSSSNRFSVIYGRNFESKGTTASASGLMSFNNSSGNALVRIQAGNTTPTGVASSGGMFDGSSLTGSLAVYTVNDATADATATKDLLIETGNKTAGTGDSGDIAIQTGTSAGGTRGDILLHANKVQVGGAFGAARDLASVDGSGFIQMGQSGVSMFMNGQTVPAVTSSLNLGNTFLRWLSVSADAYEGPGGEWTLQTMPGGETSVSAIVTSSLIDAGIATGNNTNADAVATRLVLIQSGNKTAGTGNSGAIEIQTGTSAGGTRGNITLDGFVVDASASDSAFHSPNLSSDPSSLSNGMIWYNTTSNQLKARVNGSTVVLA